MSPRVRVLSFTRWEPHGRQSGTSDLDQTSGLPEELGLVTGCQGASGRPRVAQGPSTVRKWG